MAVPFNNILLVSRKLNTYAYCENLVMRRLLLLGQKKHPRYRYLKHPVQLDKAFVLGRTDHLHRKLVQLH